MLPTKFLQIIEVVVFVAVRSCAAPVSQKQVSEAFGCSVRYFETSIQALVRHGLLKSVKGNKGGYSLAKEKRKITLADIYSVYRECEQSYDDEAIHSEFGKNFMPPVLESVENTLQELLNAITVEALSKKANISYDEQEVFNI